MFCAKILGQCPHNVITDPNFVFVLMPFENSASIYDCIKRTTEGFEKKKFTCERADQIYTSADVWCNKICRSIRRAKYLIVDTTGLNANVFYELGFAHALGQARNIIITQKIADLPFDVKSFNAIEYTEKDFPRLKTALQKALMDMEDETGPAADVQTPETMIEGLKAQLKEEEQRAAGFKNEARESEKREDDLKRRIDEMEAILKNPQEETQKLIAEKEGYISSLQSEIKYLDQKKKDEVKLLEKRLAEEKQQRANLEKELEKFNKEGDAKKLSQAASKVKKQDWETQLFKQGNELRYKGNFAEAANVFTQLIEKMPKSASAYFYRALSLYKLNDYDSAIADLNQAIALDPKFAEAFNNRGLCYNKLKNYDRAVADFNQSIALNPKTASTFNNRGIVYYELKEYASAIADLNQAITLDPKFVSAHQNLSESLIITNEMDQAEMAAITALQSAQSLEDRAICNYLLAISLRLQGKETNKVDKKLHDLLTKDFQITWSFEEIEHWLKEAKISKEIKNYIKEITELFKKHL
jgi:tetratricopeptide (TPR) repeat protein